MFNKIKPHSFGAYEGPGIIALSSTVILYDKCYY